MKCTLVDDSGLTKPRVGDIIILNRTTNSCGIIRDNTALDMLLAEGKSKDKCGGLILSGGVPDFYQVLRLISIFNDKVDFRVTCPSSEYIEALIIKV